MYLYYDIILCLGEVLTETCYVACYATTNYLHSKPKNDYWQKKIKKNGVDEFSSSPPYLCSTNKPN